LLWLGLFPSGMGEDSLTPSTSPPGECHGRKRLLLGKTIANWAVGSDLPREAQLLVARVGSRLLAGVPAEVTTTAARRMRDSMLAASRTDPRVNDAVIVGLANGFIQYVTTPEEYTAQFYEGGSTIYGPGEADMLARQLARLSAARSAGDALPATEEIRVKPGARRKPHRAGGDERPTVESAWCSGDTLHARLGLGRAGGWLVRDSADAEQPLVEILRDSADRAVVKFDDDPEVELHRDGGGGDAPWLLRWSGAEPGRYLVRVREGSREATAVCGPEAGAERRDG